MASGFCDYRMVRTPLHEQQATRCARRMRDYRFGENSRQRDHMYRREDNADAELAD